MLGIYRSSVIEKQHSAAAHHNTTTMRAATTLATLATAVFSALPASSGFEIVEDHRNLQVAGDEEAARALMHVVSEIHFTVILIEIILYYVFLPFPGSSASWNVADEGGIDSVVLCPRGVGTYILCIIHVTSYSAFSHL
jgi:hypothetical protein